MPSFDISTKIITKKHKAWVLHAGVYQRNIQDFVNHELVFLETPYLEITDDIIGSPDLTRRALRRSHAFNKYHNTTGASSPSPNLMDYDSKAFEKRAVSALSGGIRRLFGAAQKGDIIITPGTDKFEDRPRPVIYFGEIIEDVDYKKVFTGSRKEASKVPYRKVRWLNKVPRKQISLQLDRRIGKPPALRDIPITRDTEEILKKAYKSYMFGDASSSMIEADKYDGSDFITLTKSQNLISTLVAAYHAYTTDNLPEKIEDLDEFVSKNFREAAVENIEIDFASPGFWRIAGATSSLAAFVGLGIAILTSDADTFQMIDSLSVTNSVSERGATEEDLEKNMKAFLNSIDRMDLEKIKQSATEAKKDIGLKSSVIEIGP